MKFDRLRIGAALVVSLLAACGASTTALPPHAGGGPSQIAYPSGNRAWSSSVAMQGLRFPLNIAVDSNRTLYIAGGDTVLVMPHGHAPTPVGPRLGGFDGVITDTAGNIFVAATQRNAVLEISPAGKVTHVGRGFSRPEGVAVDADDDVFVADSGNMAIKEVLPDGSIRKIASGFYSEDVAVDAAGDVFASDLTGNAVYKIVPSGRMTRIGHGFSGPTGLAVDSDGNVFVADLGNDSIKKVTPSGRVTTVATGFGGPTGVAVDNTGVVYVADGQSLYRVRKREVTSIGYYAPYGVALAPDGTAYFSESRNGAVYGLAPSGAIRRIGGTFTYPIGVAAAPDGSIYVADTGANAIVRIGPHGKRTAVGRGFKEPSGVAVDASGNVYVADTGNSAVKEVRTDGKIVRIGHGFLDPSGVAVRNGNVYVTEGTVYSGIGRVVRVSSDGKVRDIGGLRFCDPIGISVDGGGNVFVADYCGDIKEITADGRRLRLPGSYLDPWGVAVSRDGKTVFATNTGFATLQKFTSSGGG